MSTTTALYEKSPTALPPEEVQGLAVLKLEDVPALILDDDDDFEIPQTPPDNGEWFDIWVACPYPFEVPRCNDPIPPSS